jgi:hypothetical protein
LASPSEVALTQHKHTSTSASRTAVDILITPNESICACIVLSVYDPPRREFEAKPRTATSKRRHHEIVSRLAMLAGDHPFCTTGTYPIKISQAFASSTHIPFDAPCAASLRIFYRGGSCATDIPGVRQVARSAAMASCWLAQASRTSRTSRFCLVLSLWLQQCSFFLPACRGFGTR